MIEVIVVGEGQTEESFIRDLVAPVLADREVFVQARLIRTSRLARGGALSRDRVFLFLRNTLRERSNVYVTTFFDLYGLAPDFPGCSEASALADPIARAMIIEQRFSQEVIDAVGCRADRFLPHIQPFEFEALLFAEAERLIEVEPAWRSYAEPLQAARAGVATPEHINDGADTHPSARLEMLRPRFQKVPHGPTTAARIGLGRIRQECLHFDGWLSRIEGLSPL